MKGKIENLKLLVALFFAVIICDRLIGQNSYQTVNYIDKWDTITVLKNPYKGWYHHILDNQIKAYPIRNDSVFEMFPGIDHLYIRLSWGFFEPKEGEYDWHYINDIVKKYVPEGYGISFRIVSKETGQFPDAVALQKNGVNYATPCWVEEAGARGTIATAYGIKSWTPVWNDSVYLAKLDQFHKEFAKRYDGKPWVRYVDIGSMGDWGGDIKELRKYLPKTFLNVRLDPVKINNLSDDELEKTITGLVTDSDDPWLTGLCCINMDDKVADSKINVIFRTVENLRQMYDVVN